MTASLQNLLYVGTFTDKGSEGIYTFRFDPLNGKLAYITEATGVKDPSYVALGPNHTLYAINAIYEFQDQPTGSVSAFSIDPHTGGLTLINQQSSQGKRPAFIWVESSQRYVLVANFGEGSVAIYSIKEDGGIGEATDVVQHKGKSVHSRQNGPHAHSIVTDPTNHYALSADLGTDTIYVYRMDLTQGRLHHHSQVKAEPGAGPRHICFHPNQKHLFVTNEINATITTYEWRAHKGFLYELNTVSTLPQDFQGENTTSDVHVSRCGRFVYASNRGHNSIVAYLFNEYTSEMECIGHQSTEGIGPRSFVIDPSGKYLLVANQDSNTIVTFGINADTGKLIPTENVIKVPTPVCLKFYT